MAKTRMVEARELGRTRGAGAKFDFWPTLEYGLSESLGCPF